MKPQVHPSSFAESAEISADGQVLLPLQIQKILGLEEGSRVYFIADNHSVRLVNAAVYAMEELRSEISDVALSAGWKTSDDVIAACKALRAENA